MTAGWPGGIYIVVVLVLLGVIVLPAISPGGVTSQAEMVVCTSLTRKVVTPVLKNVQTTAWGFTYTDMHNNKQWYMKADEEQCMSIDPLDYKPNG